MHLNYLMQLDYLLRLFLAVLCGSAIGYERNSRMKEAGIRTHFIVAIGSSLIMIVSKYGFQDQFGWLNMTLDPSRIAAQVVSGVGFLGAGIIFTHRQTVIGLTTAAGIWATAGIGLAIGSGLYAVGLAATAIIILGQILFHGKIKWLSSPKNEQLILQIIDEPGAAQSIQKIFEDQHINIISFKAAANKESAELIDLKILIRVYESYNISKLLFILQDNPIIKSLEF
ncbi:MgtC/SapB family protein [Desulfosporosinus sp. PR]|uniref:MgtC/SapB family protein n=1 Tax=Candidatus Desulfosporosinus nitrosoreducens TaxID=3401928 RepID=UPI0027FDC137|nr:MgtC/SapB family protein [Desulfosporosinus sp. PR]MDQ7092983.1 MgtC/SapB family protein [Desulfosporosinus sp. PR]